MRDYFLLICALSYFHSTRVSSLLVISMRTDFPLVVTPFNENSLHSHLLFSFRETRRFFLLVATPVRLVHSLLASFAALSDYRLCKNSLPSISDFRCRHNNSQVAIFRKHLVVDRYLFRPVPSDLRLFALHFWHTHPTHWLDCGRSPGCSNDCTKVRSSGLLTDMLRGRHSNSRCRGGECLWYIVVIIGSRFPQEVLVPDIRKLRQDL